MKDNQRLIKICQDKIYYTYDEYITVSQTNLPHEKMKFSFNHNFFWEVELIKHETDKYLLTLKVTNYSPSDTSRFNDQKDTFLIKKIEFETLDWKSVEGYLSTYFPIIKTQTPFSKGNLNEYEEEPEKYFTEETPSTFIKESESEVDKREPVVELIEKEFNHSFEDSEFHSGYVLIRKLFQFYPELIEFQIFNPDILPEYEYIKNYFPKALGGSKMFSVKVAIEFTDGRISKSEARSLEIESINENIIDIAKFYRTKKVIDFQQKSDGEKQLFSADDLFSKMEESGAGGNVFVQDADDIIKTVLELPNIRNKRQLQYLAGQMHNPIQKIKFTLKPLFGFLFFIQGDQSDHFCWELLESHATYLWSISRTSNLEIQSKRIERAISVIRKDGRNSYKNAYRTGLIDKDIQFYAINHKTENENRFTYWKKKLNEKIV